jgi:hypothetical protein
MLMPDCDFSSRPASITANGKRRSYSATNASASCVTAASGDGAPCAAWAMDTAVTRRPDAKPSQRPARRSLNSLSVTGADHNSRDPAWCTDPTIATVSSCHPTDACTEPHPSDTFDVCIAARNSPPWPPYRGCRSRLHFCAPRRNKPHAPTVGANKTGLTLKSRTRPGRLHWLGGGRIRPRRSVRELHPCYEHPQPSTDRLPR